MLVSLPIAVALLIALGIPPVRLSKKFKQVHWWDYALPAIGLPVWIVLSVAEVGNTASLANMVIEVMIVLAVSVMTPWARYMVLYANNPFALGIYRWMYLIPLAVALFIRMTMPTLPE